VRVVRYLHAGPVALSKAFWLNFQMLNLVEIISAVQSRSPDRWLLIIHPGKGVRRRQRSSHLPCERTVLFGRAESNRRSERCSFRVGTTTNSSPSISKLPALSFLLLSFSSETLQNPRLISRCLASHHGSSGTRSLHMSMFKHLQIVLTRRQGLRRPGAVGRLVGQVAMSHGSSASKGS
jgi:hypothetical protein